MFQTTAEHLTGRKARLEWRVPDKGLRGGQAYREGDTGIIVIDPDLDAQESMKVFLHEVGHIVHSWDLWGRQSGKGRPSEMGRLLGGILYSLNEIKAEIQAQTWGQYARSSGGPTIAGQLLALQKWQG